MTQPGDDTAEAPPTPPRLLERAPREHQAMSPMRESTDLAALHRLWADLHGAGATEGAQGPAGRGLRGKVVRQIGSVAADVSEPAQRADRALIGALIRTNDALAIRCDELGSRVVELEDLLREVVSVVGDDLVQVRAALQSATSPPTDG
jgi:hypothetical protein